MNWHKLVSHDLRCGLLRPAYLLAVIVPLISGLSYWSLCGYAEKGGSWLEFFFYLFKGQKYVQIDPVNPTQIPLPMTWLLAAGFCLFLNLHYFLYDLTLNGQQLMIRSGSRVRWFLSKCIWNLASCTLYFCILGVSGGIVTCLVGGPLSLRTDPYMIAGFLNLFSQPELSVFQGIAVGLLLPFLTVAALSLLEMTLSMIIKPVLALILSIGLLVLSVLYNSGWILGTGAMTVRNQWVSQVGVSAAAVTVVTVGTILICTFIGAVFFRRMDILPSEADL